MPEIARVGGAIGNRGAVPIEHDRLEAAVERPGICAAAREWEIRDPNQ